MLYIVEVHVAKHVSAILDVCGTVKTSEFMTTQVKLVVMNSNVFTVQIVAVTAHAIYVTF